MQNGLDKILRSGILVLFFTRSQGATLALAKRAIIHIWSFLNRVREIPTG
jgi:hypothetical protein